MKSYSNLPLVERAQPWLGTLVSMRVRGLPTPEAHRAIDAAFQEIAAVHRLMSFHQDGSDVSRLNRQACRGAVNIHPWTFEVLESAQRFAALSDGCFDISTGAELVRWKLLPQPAGVVLPPEGSWHDIELRSDRKVRFHRPLWIDLGGIAKGYAVDRAIGCLRRLGAPACLVNAGGDLRTSGGDPELIALTLRMPVSYSHVPVIELREGSIASSRSGQRHRGWRGGGLRGPHVDGLTRRPAPRNRFVCVLAESCMTADALTKIVIAKGTECANLLRRCDAEAHIHDPGAGWLHVETEAQAA